MKKADRFCFCQTVYGKRKWHVDISPWSISNCTDFWRHSSFFAINLCHLAMGRYSWWLYLEQRVLRTTDGCELCKHFIVVSRDGVFCWVYQQSVWLSDIKPGISLRGQQREKVKGGRICSLNIHETLACCNLWNIAKGFLTNYHCKHTLVIWQLSKLSK